ncbi:amidase [Marinivivus vitaminiproducens]|uniref:amidase n=1 Tax=Marinivivus vitaminiproducens TaxID=3035935 RepID=UPI0027A0C3B9|nr:amidase [Geminicoccaceae bacterium SCSIO 64248]
MQAAATQAGFSARAAALAIRSGELRSVDLVRSCLERIAERDPNVHAWAALDAERALDEARQRDAEPATGPLHGVPVGVKDVFATAQLPTGCGSPIYAGDRPGADAASVALLRAAGAIVLGKTVTTEFASRHPGPTAHPLDPAHSPGGSSSGSAAAVADRQVPFALGTQTAGSVIRPAAYCGVVGYKPSRHLIPRAGVKQTSETLDTVGVFAREVGDAALAVAVMSGRPALAEIAALEVEPRFALCRSEAWPGIEPEGAAGFDAVARRLRQLGVLDGERAVGHTGLLDVQNAIMTYEIARSLAFERLCHADRLSAELTRLLAEGDAVDVASYDEALARRDEARAGLADLLDDGTLLIAPSAPGMAPKGLSWTGDPMFNRIWTLLGVPCVTVPAPLTGTRLPLGIQIVGREGDDARVLAAADWLAPRLA